MGARAAVHNYVEPAASASRAPDRPPVIFAGRSRYLLSEEDLPDQEGVEGDGIFLAVSREYHSADVTERTYPRRRERTI